MAQRPAADLEARIAALRSSKEQIQTVGELLRLELVTYADYAVVAPLMTVFSGRTAIDLNRAPDLLRRTLEASDGSQNSSNRLRRGQRMHVSVESLSKKTGATIAISGGASAAVQLEAIESPRRTDGLASMVVAN